MPEVADDALPPLSEYERYTRTGDLWVVGDPPVAFAIVEDLDANTHVDQLSLDPNWSRRGIGRSLLDHVTGLARAQGRPFVTLTTFVAVPWNTPYYRRLGFDEVPEDEMDPGLPRDPRCGAPAVDGPPPCPRRHAAGGDLESCGRLTHRREPGPQRHLEGRHHLVPVPTMPTSANPNTGAARSGLMATTVPAARTPTMWLNLPLRPIAT